ncbi:MAG: DUF192 domain-containing protein [Candidatus Micrarchaeaceae archaeon]
MCFTKLLYKITKFKTKKLKIGKKTLNVLLADSFSKQLLGLMYRKSLAKNEGMLFIFKKSSKYGIWMLNMKFNIDIIWLDNNLKIIDSLQNVKPCTSLLKCKTYYPKSPSKYVLEVNSGFISQNKIKNSVKVKFI